MLDVTFRRDSRDRLSSILADGHVEIPETSSDEYSLVCAAVSGILQAARLGLQAYTRIPLDVVQERGRQELRWPEGRRNDEAIKAYEEGIRAAEVKGDIQAAKEMAVFLKRLQK